MGARRTLSGAIIMTPGRLMYPRDHGGRPGISSPPSAKPIAPGIPVIRPRALAMPAMKRMTDQTQGDVVAGMAASSRTLASISAHEACRCMVSLRRMSGCECIRSRA